MVRGVLYSLQSQAMSHPLYLEHQIPYINPTLVIVASLNNSMSQGDDQN